MLIESEHILRSVRHAKKLLAETIDTHKADESHTAEGYILGLTMGLKMFNTIEEHILFYLDDDLDQMEKDSASYMTVNSLEGGIMKNDEKHIENQLNRLSDELIANIIDTPDEAILKEVTEDHGDPSYEANSVRDILKKSRVNAGKNRLKNARENLEKAEDTQEDLRNRIQGLEETHPH
jgi:hypothetical protein